MVVPFVVPIAAQRSAVSFVKVPCTLFLPRGIGARRTLPLPSGRCDCFGACR